MAMISSYFKAKPNNYLFHILPVGFSFCLYFCDANFHGLMLVLGLYQLLVCSKSLLLLVCLGLYSV